MGAIIDAFFYNTNYLVLLMFRVGGLVYSSPIFGRVNIPGRAKISLVLALCGLFFFVFPQPDPVVYPTLMSFVIVCAGELLLGITLAFITNMFFTLMFTAGQLIDMQIGFGIVNVFDIQNNTQVPMMGNFLNVLLLMVFFAVNGHLRLIETVYLTIERMPIGTLMFAPEIGLLAFEVFSRAFLLGVMISLPVVASGLILQIALGVTMRMVPQIHMFVVGIPIKMILGLVVFMTTLPVFVHFSDVVFSEMWTSMERMFSMFVG